MFVPVDYERFTIASVCGIKKPRLNQSYECISSITTSSVEAIPGSLFVPLTDKRDGHEFIADALERGASAFFLKTNHPISKKLSQKQLAAAIKVDDPLLALGRLAQFHRRRFAPIVIAVTGSNGKTTTKEMLAQILKQGLGQRLIATELNYNNHIGVPFTLLRIKNSTRAVVVEMGMNHAGEIAYLSQLAEPDMAIITSIGHAHIEFFASRAGIAAAKAEIILGMKPGAPLFLPAGIAEFGTISRAAKRHKIQMRSIKPELYQFRYPNPAWLSNYSLAAAAARELGLSDEIIEGVAKNFKSARGRMQLKKGYFTVIDDGYNANPDSALASIDSALLIAQGRPVICVFGDFKELGKFSRKLHTWTGKESRRRGVTAFYGVGQEMKAAVAAFRGRKFHFTRDSAQALVKALRQEPKGAVILVKGSRSMRMEEIASLLLASP